MDPIEGINFERPPPRIRWTAEQRVFLCCLFRFFQRDRDAFLKVFSSAFRAELKEQGFTTGPSFWTLHSQWDTMKRKGDLIWGNVNLSPFENEGVWFRIIQKIQETALAENISLVEKDYDDINTSDFRYQYHTLDRLETVMDSATQPEEDTTAPEEQQSEPSDEPPLLCTGGGKICLWCHHEITENEAPPRRAPLPDLLYRWSNIDSQGINSKKLFLAGLFAENEDYSPPHQFQQAKFNEYVVKHLSIQKSLSPFISTFKSMLSPTHRALRNKEGAIISIIDREKLQTPVYSAMEFVRSLNIDLGWYNGAGEYLIWGKIPHSAIVCSFKITSLLEIEKENPDIGSIMQLETIASFQKNRKLLHRALAQGPGGLDRQSGTIIGKFLALAHVPYEYSNSVGARIYYSWRLSRNGSWVNFYQGIREGYQSTTEEPLPMPIATEIPQERIDLEDSSDEDLDEMLNEVPPSDDSSDASSDDETVTDEVPEPTGGPSNNQSTASPSPSPCAIPIRTARRVETFDAISRQWVPQRDTEEEEPLFCSKSSPSSPGSTHMLDSSDDELTEDVLVTTQSVSRRDTLATQSWGSPDLEDFQVEDSVVLVNGQRRFRSQEARFPTPAIPLDRFATDRARVMSTLSLE